MSKRRCALSGKRSTGGMASACWRVASALLAFPRRHANDFTELGVERARQTANGV